LNAIWQVCGQFDSEAALRQAVERLNRAGVPDYEVYSPVLTPESLELHMPRWGSPVWMVSTVGGVAGLAVGLALAILSSRIYGLITGGKPEVSLVPFVIVGFEVTILLAGLGTVVALFYWGHLGPVAPPSEYDERFSNDRYGLYVRCDPGRREEIVQLLQDSGATEIKEGDRTSA
jgi:molybdopterin-containing oxidoreductase family membrane subunit